MAGAEFIIYKLNEDGTIADYAKDPNGEYIGAQNENGDYVVITDSNGIITAPLTNGSYKLVEAKAPTGYALDTSAQIITITEGNKWTVTDAEDERVFEIYTIEDLVRFSNGVSNGLDYKDYTVKLMNTIDFNDDNSYINPNSAKYGDLNGDGVNESIKTELTKEGSKGFMPIGASGDVSFKGTFDGQGYEIRNIYMDTASGIVISANSTRVATKAGLFWELNGATIKNLGITGVIYANRINNGGVGSITGAATNSTIMNCYNKADIYATASSTSSNISVSGIGAGTVINCYNRGNLKASDGKNITMAGISTGKVSNSYSTGTLEYENFSGTVTIGAISTGSNAAQNSYYIDSITNTTVTDGATSKSDADMKTEEFVELLGTDNYDSDRATVNDGYPVLKNYKGNYVTEINYIEDLQELSNQVNSGIDYTGITVTLMRDLDFNEPSSYKDEAELTNTSIGTSSNNFKGKFKGQNHEISNLFINSQNTDVVGLFGYTQSAEITGVGISGKVSATNSSAQMITIGGIVGLPTNTKVIDCYNKAEVFANMENAQSVACIFVGGIAGRLNSSKINNCYNAGNIKSKLYASGTEYLGGICAYDGSSNSSVCVDNCYNRGNITSETSQSANTYISGISWRI